MLPPDVFDHLLPQAPEASRRHRQLSRSLDCAKTSVTRQAERLGRHAVLFHARCNANLPSLTEAVVHDHFEAFIGRQDRALGIGTAVGANSRYVYDIDPAPHRGSGRRPDRKPEDGTAVRVNRSYVESIRRSIRALIPHLAGVDPLVLRSVSESARGVYLKLLTPTLPAFHRRHAH